MTEDTCLIGGERFTFDDAAQCFTTWDNVSEEWALICDKHAHS